MTTEQKIEWEQLEKTIYTVFKEVTLESGIGYYEAEAIDEYLVPTDKEYQIRKAKDEREDWTKLVSFFSDNQFDSFPHSFMDAKGLHFYLPVFMIRKDETINTIFYFYISELFNRPGYLPYSFTKTVALMTKEQKQCICFFYKFLSKINYPGFSKDELNSPFETGDRTMQGFDFIVFIENQFGQ